MLAYIALADGCTETRERLVGLFWSESEGVKAHASLRQAVREIRLAFERAGFDGLRATRLDLGLDRARVTIDVRLALHEAEAGRVHPLLLNTSRVTERLLEGFDDLDPALRVWLLARRQTLHDRLLRALEAGLTDMSLPERDRARMAEAILNLDPTHEDACRRVMRAKAEAGDIGAALRVYKELWDLLGDEYDMEPSTPTQELVAEIKRGLIAPATAPPPPDAAGDREPRRAALPDELPRTELTRSQSARLVLCVEPFAMDGVEAANAYIVNGFRHHLIASLVRFREWYVTERATLPDPAPASGQACARYSLQVTAYQGGAGLYLVLSVKEIGTASFIWSDRFHLARETMFEVQQQIIQRITVALNIQLSAERLVRLSRQAAVPAPLHDRWLLGHELRARFQPAAWQEAASIFEGLIRDAPDFGPAYSSLVQMRNTAHIVNPGIFRSPAQHPHTLALAKTAAQLDPVDSRAQLCLGWSHAFGAQFDQALLHFDLACDLNDGDPWTLISSAHAHAFCGEFAAACSLAEKAKDIALVPTSAHWAYAACVRFMLEDYAGCIEAARLSQDLRIETGPWKAAAEFHLRRYDEARETGARFIERAKSEWRDPVQATEERIGRWFLHLFPIREETHWQRLRDGLAGAGISVETADFGRW